MQLDPQQQQAVDALGKNVLVSASAGAGKTGVLVQRLKKRVIQDRVRVSRILAMTFTAAAAAEMKKRLASELHIALQNSTNEEEKTWITQQLIELEAANITTIDSYCLTIIKKYYSVIGIDPATTTNILSEGNVNLLKTAAYETALCKMMEEDPKAAQELLEYFSPRCEDYTSLFTILNKINTHAQSVIEPEQWYTEAKESYAHITHIKDLKPSVLQAFFERLTLKVSTLQTYCSQMRQFAEGDAKVDLDMLNVKENKIVNCLNALQEQNYSSYSMFLESLALAKTKPGSKENQNYKDARKKLNDSIKKLLEENYDAKMLIQDHNDLTSITNSLVDLAQNTWNIFIQYKQQKAAMDFTDMERYAYNILCANQSTIAAILKDSFDEIMVDEFQDTSDLQNAIIDMISNGHNVFRVGDVKQSIYRFRQAKPSLMRNLMQDENTIQITLRHNFRSMNSIVEFSNHLFSKIMNVDGCQDTYTEKDCVSIGSQRQEESIVPIEFALIQVEQNDETDEEDDLSAKEQKAHWITKKILQMKKEDASLTWKNFCILVRSHNDKAVIRSAFDQYNIPYLIDAREGFYQSELCQTILSMIHAIIDPRDEVSLLSVLVSSFYQFSDEQLANLYIHHHSIYMGIQNEYPEILEELQELQTIADEKGVLALLTQISIRHDFYNQLNASQKANFDYLFETTCNAKYASLADFLETMEASEDEKSSEAVSKGKDDDVVTVTTIHQSKGLQYNVVFLWSSSRNLFRDTAEPVMIDDVMKLGINHINENYRVRRPTIQRMAVEYHANLEDIEEFIRLLYVAITRAEKRMFIVDAVKKDIPKQEVDLTLLNERPGMTGLIINAMKDDPYFRINSFIAEDVEKEKPISKNYVSQLPSLSITPEHLLQLHTPSSTEFSKLPELDETSQISGTNYGTKIHAIFEELPNTQWDEKELSTYSISKTLQNKFLAFSNSEIYKEALTMEIHKEFPFYISTKDERITGVMDFVAIGTNKIILIDYKTDNASLEEIKKRYTSQINTYKKALQYMYSTKNISAYAYSIHNAEFIEI